MRSVRAPGRRNCRPWSAPFGKLIFRVVARINHRSFAVAIDVEKVTQRFSTTRWLERKPIFNNSP